MLKCITDLLETNTSAVDHEINLYLYPFYKQEDDTQNTNVVNIPLFVNKVDILYFFFKFSSQLEINGFLRIFCGTLQIKKIT